MILYAESNNDWIRPEDAWGEAVARTGKNKNITWRELMDGAASYALKRNDEIRGNLCRFVEEEGPLIAITHSTSTYLFIISTEDEMTSLLEAGCLDEVEQDAGGELKMRFRNKYGKAWEYTVRKLTGEGVAESPLHFAEWCGWASYPNKIWMRVGGTVDVSAAEAYSILQGGNTKLLRQMILDGRFKPDGDCYVPAEVIAEINEKCNTSFSVRDFNFEV